MEIFVMSQLQFDVSNSTWTSQTLLAQLRCKPKALRSFNPYSTPISAALAVCKFSN
jgi:hypothetical protein